MSRTRIKCSICRLPYVYCVCASIVAKAIATGRVWEVDYGWGYQISGSSGSSTYEDVINWYKKNIK